MTDKTISSIGKVGGDYFRFYYNKKYGKIKLNYYLDQFNIEDYYIYKSTNKFRQVSIEDFYNFNYACYTLFKKDKYNNLEINEWIDFLLNITKSEFMYLIKPLPPKEIMDKIKIIQ